MGFRRFGGSAKPFAGRRGKGWSRASLSTTSVRLLAGIHDRFGEAAAHPRVVDRERASAVGTGQHIARSEEDIVTAQAVAVEIVVSGAVAGGDQSYAAIRVTTATDSLFLPLVDVLGIVGIGGDEGFGGLEKHTVSVCSQSGNEPEGAERRGKVSEDEGLEARASGRRRPSGDTGQTVEPVRGAVVAVHLREF